MKTYRVQIDFMPIGYEVEAENEDKAIEYAEECFFQETNYDILKHAKYTIDEVGI
jgi:hypothetical protein